MVRGRVRKARILLPLLILFLSGCGGPQGNMLKNPGFEEGSQSWFWLEGENTWLPFSIAETPVLSGNRSLRHDLAPKEGASSVVVGTVQEIQAKDLDFRIPDRLEGHYFIQNWTSNLNRTYLQIVVMAFPFPNNDVEICPGIPKHVACQLAYALVGVEERPINVGNRRFVFPDLPADQGQWHSFELEPRKDFETYWGVEPRRFERLRVYIETRYDSSPWETPQVDLEIYWDDFILSA